MLPVVRIGFVGAGHVNFGGGEGPWDHASRLETLDGIEVVGIADPETDRAHAALAARRHPMFHSAGVYADVRELLAMANPDAVWIGVPPNAHGDPLAGENIEILCAEAGAHVFTEKPLSCGRPDQVRPVAEALARPGILSSVGYMFRYSSVIDTVRDILADTAGGPRAFLARYNCAYSEIRKREWWDVRSSGGPIVEQATHFVDLARYLVGDVALDSVRAVRIDATSEAGVLCDAPRGADGATIDSRVPAAHRSPRGTAAVWQFTGGAIGSLSHATLLHRRKYETELEIWGDGLRLVLSDLYGDCRLHARQPGSETTEEVRFERNDPYLEEDRAFLEAVRTQSEKPIRSPYSDAMKTFALTWAITDAASRPATD